MKPFLLAVAMVLGVGSVGALAADAPAIRMLDESSSVFADSAATWRVELSDTNSLDGFVAWSLSVSGGVVARREQSVNLQANVPMAMEIATDLPPVGDGVVVDGQLEFTLQDGQHQLRAEQQHPVYLYGRNPTAYRAEWIKNLNLHVFDPDGETAKRLDELEWPYRLISNLSAFDSLGDAVLIVGEGVSLRDHRGLMESAVRMAQKGGHVLFLAPVEGRVALGGILEGHPRPTSMRFVDETIVHELDKRLDVPAVRSTFRLGGQRTGPELVVEPAGGWSCIEMRWPDGGTLLLVGFGLLDTWESSPAPRYLLVRMVEWATTEKERQE